VIFRLPKPLAAELDKYARIRHGGNKSGFTAEAVRFYIEHLRKTRHTQKLRESYAAAAQKGLAITKEWEPLDDEAWAKLDEHE
jgi:hypothetical protein